MSDKISDERDEFEKIFPIPTSTIRCGYGYAVTSYSAWDGRAFMDKWEGWKACRRATEVKPVKLPQIYKMDGFDGIVPAKDKSDGFLFYAEDVLAALQAAGGIVEGE